MGATWYVYTTSEKDITVHEYTIRTLLHSEKILTNLQNQTRITSRDFHDLIHLQQETVTTTISLTFHNDALL